MLTYELLVGRLPFEALEEKETVEKIRRMSLTQAFDHPFITAHKKDVIEIEKEY